jgi:hypothetical protein
MSAIWGKVYGSLHSSLKWQRANDSARALWVTALSWSIAQGSDGVVPSDALRMLGSRRSAANKLVEVGLWEVEGDGWRFHDWLGHNVSDQQIQDQREATRTRVQKHRVNKSNGVTSPTGNALHVTPRNTARTEQNRTEEEGVRSQGHQSDRHDEPPPLETSIPSHVLPASWGPTTRHKAYAMENGLRIAREVEKFRGNARASRKSRIDWDAEFDAWLAKSAEMTEDRATATNGAPRPGSGVWDKVNPT